jgi:hypothetical protein
MADTASPVQVIERKETVIGQPQARPADPHDGATRVHEVVVHTDRHILDPNDPLAVQIPEGVGASTIDYSVGLADAMRAGTAEQQFAKAGDYDHTPASDHLGSPQASAEAKSDNPAPTEQAKSEDKKS